jgi:tetratricopeptide (TPR) repeat protein
MIGDMPSFKRQAAHALCALLFLGFSGCEEMPKLNLQAGKTRDLADQAANEGDFERAVRLYESALDGTSKTAEIHYRLAIIYENRFQEPVSALHHFRRFLALDPSPRLAEEVEASIRRIERDLATRLGGGLMTKAEAARLRNENTELRNRLAGTRPQRTGAMPSGSAQASTDSASSEAITRTYTVKAGDTLASISRQFYNTSAKWQQIAEANQHQLQGTAIREGMVLIIP